MIENDWNLSFYYRDTVEIRLIKRLLKICDKFNIKLCRPELDEFGIWWKNRNKRLTFYFDNNLILTMESYQYHPYADIYEHFEVKAPTVNQIVEELNWITDPYSKRYGTELNELFKVSK